MSGQLKRRAKPGSAFGERAAGLGVLVGRILIWSAIAIAALGLVVGFGFGLQSLLLTRNPHFTLRRIDITATGEMPPTEILDLLRSFGVERDASNLFAIDLRKLLRHLEDHVAVERATVARRLPDTLAVSIFERQPIAQLRRRGRLLLDVEGWLLPARFDAKSLSLPIITGVKTDPSVPRAKRITDEVGLAAVKFLQLIATRSDGQFYDVSMVQLDYSLPALRVFLRPKGTFRQGARVIVPVRQMEEALDRLSYIVRERTQRKQPTYSIDATFEVNVPVLP